MNLGDKSLFMDKERGSLRQGLPTHGVRATYTVKTRQRQEE